MIPEIEGAAAPAVEEVAQAEKSAPWAGREPSVK